MVVVTIQSLVVNYWIIAARNTPGRTPLQKLSYSPLEAPRALHHKTLVDEGTGNSELLC